MSAERDRQLHQQRGAKRVKTTDVATPGSRGLRPVFNSSAEASQQSSDTSVALEADSLRRRVPAPSTHFGSYQSHDAAPRPPPTQSAPIPAQYQPAPAPRPSMPLPRQPQAAPLPSGPPAYLPNGYRADFGGASALGDFAFDFALPASSYDAQGGLQYHMGIPNHHLPTPPSYHTAFSTPNAAHDVKPQLYDSYATSQRPYY